MSVQKNTEALFDGRSLRVFFGLIVASGVILGWIGWNLYGSFKTDEKLESETHRVLSLKGTIMHHDEAMTMAARMAAVTGDLSWEKRYRQMEPALDSALAEASGLLRPESSFRIGEMRDANLKLVKMEKLAFALVREGKTEEARRVVFGGEYKNQKDAYQIGTTVLSDRLNGLSESHRRLEAKRVYFEWATIVVSLLVLFFGWAAAFVLFQRWQFNQRRRVAEKLDATEQSFRALIENIPDVVWTSDKNGDSFYLSPNVEQVYGFTADEMIKDSANLWLGRIHPEDCQMVIGALERLFDFGEKFDVEYRIQRKDGAWIWVHDRAMRTYMKDGVKCVDGIFSDVTRRKNSEVALRESEERFRQLAENITEVFWMTDPAKNRIIYISPAYENVWGRTCASLISSPREWIEAIHPEDRDRVMEAAVSKQTKGSYDEEYRIVRPDGQVRWIRDRAFPLKNATGENYRVVGVALDITDQKRAEREIRDLAKFPSENPNPIFRISEVGTMLYSNKPGLEILKTFESAGVPERWTEVAQAVLKSGKTMEIEIECGRQTFTLLFSPAVDAGYVNVYGMNVTLNRNLENQLRQSQKMEAVGVLAGGVAHEFNNILTAVTFSAGFLKEGIPLADPLQHDIKEILKAAARAGALTQQLLNYSQKQLLEPKLLSLNELIGGFQAMLGHALGESVRLSTKLADDLWPVTGDESSLEQVFATLASNARDAMPNGGRFSISTENICLIKGPVGSYVRITVSDTGKGIEPSVMPRLFEPFFTTKGRVKGTGLGLASVYGIVKQNGGFIEIESQPGCGATFKIYLPKAEEKAKDDKTETTQLLAPSDHNVVLLVEDEASVRSMASRALRKKGYTVLETSNGEEALRTVREHSGNIHLVISDLVMPVMGGAELIPRLRSEHPEICVLVISGYSDHTGLAQCAAANAPFLQKPFTPDALCSAVKRTLNDCLSRLQGTKS
jgi:PAS domain S-box-containing protein